MLGPGGESSAMSTSYGEADLNAGDTLSLGGSIGQKGDFDRRKKKKYVLL